METMNQGLSPPTTCVDEKHPLGSGRKWRKENFWMPHNANGGATRYHVTENGVCPIGQTYAAHSPCEAGIHPDSHYRTPPGIQTKLEETPPSAWELLTYRYWKLVSAYGTVVNDGEAIQPTLITRRE